MTRRVVTDVTVTSPKIPQKLTLAVVSDLHDGPFEDLLPLLKKTDAILIVGDLVERHGNEWHNAVRFLEAAPDIAPTFYSIGNHERRLASLAEYWPHVEKSRVTVLDDRCEAFGGITIGGFSSYMTKPRVDDAVVGQLAGMPGFRLLMCHHPEYYHKYVRGRGIDLTLAGHAHGGQIQLFGHGIYAPGQGLLPRWTHGFYDDRHLLVSRGATNGNGLPRWGNPCEIIMLHLQPEG